MSSPRLPRRAAEAWDCGFVFDAARDVRSVSSRGGLVVAGGDELHLLRPGAQRMASRAPPLDIGPIRVAAAEPRAPFRYAVASDELVAVFYKVGEGEQVLRIRATPPGPRATHLAWGRDGGASALYIRWDDGAIVRMKQDMSGVDTTDLAPMDAIAADEAGVLAMLSFGQPTPRAYVTPDGENLEHRPIDHAVQPSGHVYLAVADMTVAFSVEDGGAFVSRGKEAPFVPCAHLATAGPVELEGPSSDAALFGATHHGGVASIIRVDLDGAAIRVADFGSDDNHAPALAALAWDGSRQILWGASPQMGLITCTAPSAKHGKKAGLS